ncbi:hypothetical protein GCM10011571_14260 [Marinithermofilum abyssi]|uniref:Uncharacterized protein n=1 Tax=Marinithermofilum abyssi TaxID=1571185 RepID=A0A8J2YD08_9BACL|nr:DUF6454 family protein [Marinithermofilum abyssi]GGE13959.1 hypothetical protein GCM10011571_14260 [Marinithermofilum abyssi]
MRKIVSIVAAILVIATLSTTIVLAQSDNATSEAQGLSDRFQQLSRDTKWVQEDKIPLQFDVYYPQGMTKIGDLYYMSSVEILEKPVKYEQPQNGYDRTPGKGIGHLFVFDKQGKLVKDIRLGEGDIYHPGGIAFDGKSIWVPVAEPRQSIHCLQSGSQDDEGRKSVPCR